MKKLILTASLYTAITAVLLGIVYPLAITGIAQLTMHSRANGQFDKTRRQNGRLCTHWPAFRRSGLFP